MQLTPQHRQVLHWVRPTVAQRYEIYSELELPRAVLTINSPDQALLETRFGTYTIQRPASSASVLITEMDGSLIADIQMGWWRRRRLRFNDGREFQFNSLNLLRSRWLWSTESGEPRAVVQNDRIFFSPDWPIREGLSSLLAGLTVYLIVNRPSAFPFFS